MSGSAVREQFKLYDAESGRIVSEQTAPTNGSGHGALAEGKLAYDPKARCDHHGRHHGEGHECGHLGEGRECGHHHGKGLDCGCQEGDGGCRRRHGE